MIEVSNEFRELMQSRTDFKCNAVVTFPSGDELELDGASFTLSNNSIDDSASTNSFPLGVAISRTIQIELLNDKEQYADYDFYGAKIRLYLTFALSATVEKIEMGTFTVLEPETYGDTVIITARDDMYKADKKYTTSLTYPAALAQMFLEICQRCGLPFNSVSFKNANFTVQTAPTGDLTFRQVLGYIAMIAGGNARINRGGYVRIISYDLDTLSTPQHILDSWKSLKTDTSNITITGIQTTAEAQDSDSEAVTYTFGNEGYVLSIENPLIAGQEETALQLIGAGFIGVPFRKFSGDYIAYPLIEFMDTLEFTDRKGKTHKSFVTDVNFTFFGITTLSNSAESAIRNNSKYTSPETKAIIAAKKLVEKEKTARETAMEQLEKKLNQSGGFFSTEVLQDDGSTILYMHDKPTFEESQSIIKVTAEAVGFSTDGGKTYPFGLAVNGEIIASILSAEGVNADWITTGAFTVKDSSGNILFMADTDTGEVVISAISEVQSSVNEKYDAAISNSEAMIDSALAGYVDKESYDKDKANQDSRFDSLSEETQNSIAAANEQISSVDEDMQSKFTEIYKYISFKGGVITLGASDSAVTLTIENDNIVFRKNGVEFGSWDGNYFYTGNIYVRTNESARFGNFEFRPREDGSLMLVKVGG